MKKVIFDKKNIVVFGGAGFVGSHLCEQLVKTSKVICVDNFSTGTVDNIRMLMQNDNFKFVRHDISQPIDLKTMAELADFKIEWQGIQEVYNFACPTSAKNFDDLVINTLDANSLAIKNILEIAKEYEAKLLHLSSAVVYGPRQSGNALIKEEDQGIVDFTTPRACYDEGKRFAETMCTTYRDHYDLPVKIARTFRIYGPKMLLNDGQMIPDFIVNALEGKDLTIYGDENFTTTLLFVDDAVDALIKIMESDKNEVYNVGSDVDYKLADVAQKIMDMTASKSKIVHKEPLMFMTELGKPDISKAKKHLGWFPVSTLDIGLQKTIEFARANKRLLGNDSKFE
ncbi:GDP-mannose 4,6-dehydratase [Patescibacteria group bacterium]|nr:GDP-mannose 4,6-dehydratase [Patescibacteria group bacterium]